MPKNLLYITSFLLCLPAFAQNISGKYQRTDKFPGSEESTIINFEENSSFEEVTKKHLGTSVIRKGDFEIKGDTLILYFRAPEQQDFVISKKKKISQNDSLESVQTNLLLKTHVKEEKQSSDAVIHFKDETGKTFIATTINSSEVFSLFNDAIKSIELSTLGKNDIEVNLQPLLGYSSTIDIYFSNVKSESASPMKQKFLIETLENGVVKLTSFINEEVWLLEKVQN